MIVLDTNVLVAALWSKTGASFQIIDLALAGRVRIAISVALMLEYEDVLSRARFREASWASDADLGEILDGLLNVAHRVTPITRRIRPALADQDDEMVLECAVQAKALSIVTMNVRDFRIVPQQFQIAVVRPGDYLQKLRGEAQ
jgi:putative PIN family toxin of toxin-antitoxin system